MAAADFSAFQNATDIFGVVAAVQGVLYGYIQPLANIIAAAGTVWIGYSAKLHAIIQAEEEACRRARSQLADESKGFDGKWAKLFFGSMILVDNGNQVQLTKGDFDDAFSGIRTGNPKADNIQVAVDDFIERLVNCSRVFEHVKGDPIVKLAEEKARLMMEPNSGGPIAMIFDGLGLLRDAFVRLICIPLLLIGIFCYTPARGLATRIEEKVAKGSNAVTDSIGACKDAIVNKLLGKAKKNMNYMDPRIHTGTYDPITSSLRISSIEFSRFFHDDDEEPSKKRTYLKDRLGSDEDFRRVAEMMDVFIPPELSLIEQEENLQVKLVQVKI